MAKFRKLKGTQDFYDVDALKIKHIEKVCSETVKQFGYSEMITPIFEYANVFDRVGEDSDIVTKEMYTFTDRGGRNITLRPEGTAPAVRAYIENKIYATNPGITKLYYFGPLFRYERPQAGRFRQFHQFGIEALGQDSPLLDLDVLLSAVAIIDNLGIKDITLKINSIGDLQSRNQYTEALVTYFADFTGEMCSDCKQRLQSNPLRILDCKVDANKDFIKNAPLIKDYLTQESKEYFQTIISGLDTFNIKYEIDYTLVRGLDYYTDTVFEFIINSPAQFAGLALCAGGKYATLVKDLGGPDLPGVGYAFGVERIIALLDKQNLFPTFKTDTDCFILALDEKSKLESLRLANYLRKHNIVAEIDYINYNMKNQFRLSERLNAQYIMIIGESERSKQQIAIKKANERTQNVILVKDILNHLPFKNIKTMEEEFKYENT